MRKEKLVIIFCILLLVVLIYIQWRTALPYVLSHNNSIEAQREQLPVVCFTSACFTAIYYVLFRNINKKRKFIRGLLIYFVICGFLGTLCSSIMMLLM